MQFKQDFNREQGESRTRAILTSNFICNSKSVDIDGADFGVELLPEKRTVNDKDRIQVIGRVQAKFFENHNEVKIAKEYIEDGARTDSFAMLHTDDGDNKICYFFTAIEIREQFKPRDNFYIFSLSKDRQYIEHKGLLESDINRRIEEGIRDTEESSNESSRRRIESKIKTVNPEKKEIPSLFYAKSPYAGIGEPLRENLNKLVEVILSINDSSLLRKQIIKDITAKYPYYNFILNPDSFSKEKSFDKFWILENQSEIILNQIGKNKFIKTHLKEELVKQYHKGISTIYLKYFTD